MRLTLFPVNVEVAGVAYQQVRFWAADGHADLWGLAAGKPTVVASADGFVKQARSLGQRFADGTKAKWVLQFEGGVEWLATPGAGCGCSHPLKRFDPATVRA